MERKINQYGFIVKEETEEADQVDTLEEAARMVFLNVESIQIADFIKKCSRLLGMKRVTVHFKKEIEQYLMKSLPEQFQTDGAFIWLKDEDNMTFRIAPDKEKRDVEQVSLAEIKCGIYNVIQVEEEMTLDDLTKLFSKLLGYPRRTSNLQKLVENAVKSLKQDGKIVRKSGGWRIIEN